jgi:uncharacterized protein (TIGR03437 family)
VFRMNRQSFVSLVLNGVLMIASCEAGAGRMEGQTLSLYRGLTAGAQSVAVDATGIYIFGYTYPSSVGEPLRTWARKFDVQGNDLWTQELNSCCIGGAATDATGVYLVGGVLFGPAFLRKYDRDGHELWTRQLEHGSSTDNSKVAMDASAVYVATSGTQTSVQKFDRNGNQLWIGGFDASAQLATPGLAVAPGGVYLAGGSYYWSSIPIKRFDTGGRELWSIEVPTDRPDWSPQFAADASGFYIRHVDMNGNVSLTKYDSNGAALWEHRLDGIGVSVSGLLADGTSVYVAGYTVGGLTGQCRSGTYGDAFVRRYDTSGAEVWTREFGPADKQIGFVDQAMDANGLYMVGGALVKLEKTPAVTPISKPYIFPGCVVNAASNVGGAVTPGEIVTINGSMIGPPELAPFDATLQPLAKTLAGTRVLFNGVPAPLLYVSATRSSAIVPYSIRGQSTVDVQIEYQGSLSDSVTMPVLSSRPGIYTIDASGMGLGAIVNEDGTVNSALSPARTGSVVTIYGTGGGEGDPAVADGEVLRDLLPNITLPVEVTFDDGDEDGGNFHAAEILYAGAAPSLVAGVFQINLRVPTAATTGTFFVTVGSQQVLGLAIALR